jgi:hypothetical protein
MVALLRDRGGRGGRNVMGWQWFRTGNRAAAAREGLVMRLLAEHVHTARALATWALRGAAIALLAVGCYLFLKRLVFGLMVTDMEAAFRVWMEIGEGHSASRGIAMMIIGAALALLSGRVARWAIVCPARGCPGCGYPQPEGEICPECGMRPD